MGNRVRQIPRRLDDTTGTTSVESDSATLPGLAVGFLEPPGVGLFTTIMTNVSSHAEIASPRRWWLPSLTQFLWVAFFLAILLTDWRQMLVNADGDPCWHWQMGRWMTEHRAIM